MHLYRRHRRRRPSETPGWWSVVSSGTHCAHDNPISHLPPSRERHTLVADDGGKHRPPLYRQEGQRILSRTMYQGPRYRDSGPPEGSKVSEPLTLEFCLAMLRAERIRGNQRAFIRKPREKQRPRAFLFWFPLSATRSQVEVNCSSFSRYRRSLNNVVQTCANYPNNTRVAQRSTDTVIQSKTMHIKN